MPSCDAGYIPKSSSGPLRGAPWVTQTAEGMQASTGTRTSNHQPQVSHHSHGLMAVREGRPFRFWFDGQVNETLFGDVAPPLPSTT